MMHSSSCDCRQCILPPHILKKLLESKDSAIREAARNTMMATERLRGERAVRGLAGFAAAPAAGARTIYDLAGATDLSAARPARSEAGAASQDDTVNRAFDGFGATRDFYAKIFSRDSTDGKGAPLNGYVHRGYHFNNAFWDGAEMIFGDGDGVVLTDLTKSIDVIAHELTHGVTQNTARLEYHNQSGALNESISDVFGSLVKQWSLGQAAADADWLIGKDVFTPAIAGDALRSMKNPGSAYDNPTLGRDPQPDNMSKYVHMPDTEDGDNGGVHINSGIPNKAFYLVATGLGGNAWETAGAIWYESLIASGPTTQFQQFANTTFAKAGQHFGAGSVAQKTVQSAWAEVGVRVTAISGLAAFADTRRVNANADPCAALAAKVAQLANDVDALKAAN